MNRRASYVILVGFVGLVGASCGGSAPGAAGSTTSLASPRSDGQVETTTAAPATATSVTTPEVKPAIIPPPEGFAYSEATEPSVHTGPVDAARLDYLSNGTGVAQTSEFVAGQEASYDSEGTFADSGDYVHMYVLQFASSHAADLYRSNTGPAYAVTTSSIPGIPGGTISDPVQAFADGGFAHVARVTKGVFMYEIIYVNASAAPVDLLVTLAQQQYALI